MSNTKFFSNSLIVLGGKECEVITSLAGTRLDWETVFTVPEHTIGTNNLLIFINGKITVSDRDYQDTNSHQVVLTEPIDIDSDFHAVLIRSENDSTIVGAIEWEEF